MKILLYGGSFSPPTIGHRKFAEVLVRLISERKLPYDQLWIMPCYANFTGKTLEEPQHRMAMCELAFGGLKHTRICDFEIENQLCVQTIGVIRALKDRYPQYKFGFAMGADSAASFHTWDGHEELKELLSFVILSRKGYKKVQWEGSYYISCDLPRVSSTEFRECWKNKDIKVHNIVSDDVYKYIVEQGLFNLLEK